MNSESVLALWEKHRLARKIMDMLTNLLTYNAPLSPYWEFQENLCDALNGEIPPERLGELLANTYKHGKWQEVCKHYLLEMGLEAYVQDDS